MLVERLKELLEIIVSEGMQVERFYGGDDPQLKMLLEMAGYAGQAACASVCYWWIQRHLTKGIIATPQKPAFKTGLDLVEKWIIAKKQARYEKTYKEEATPFDALVAAEDRLVHQMVSKQQFGPWLSGGNSDTNVAAMVKALKEAVQNAQIHESLLRAELSADLEEGHPWKKKTNLDADLNQAVDMYFILSVKTTKFGHSMAVRYETGTGEIHFVDPNLGHFKFTSWKRFDEVLELYWRFVWMDPPAQGAKEPAFPVKFHFLQHRIYQFRRTPKYEDLTMFLWP